MAPSLKAKISRLRKPDHMTLEAWQVALRREVRTQAEFPAEERGQPLDVQRIRGHNSQTKRNLPRGDPRVAPWRQLLLLPRFRGHYLGHVQACGIRAGQAGPLARGA